MGADAQEACENQKVLTTFTHGVLASAEHRRCRLLMQPRCITSQSRSRPHLLAPQHCFCIACTVANRHSPFEYSFRSYTAIVQPLFRNSDAQLAVTTHLHARQSIIAIIQVSLTYTSRIFRCTPHSEPLYSGKFQYGPITKKGHISDPYLWTW